MELQLRSIYRCGFAKPARNLPQCRKGNFNHHFNLVYYSFAARTVKCDQYDEIHFIKAVGWARASVANECVYSNTSVYTND